MGIAHSYSTRGVARMADARSVQKLAGRPARSRVARRTTVTNLSPSNVCLLDSDRLLWPKIAGRIDSMTKLRTSILWVLPAEWHKAMIQTPPGRSGCFEVEYPNTTWQEVPCAPAVDHGPIGVPPTMTAPSVVNSGTPVPGLSAVGAGPICRCTGGARRHSRGEKDDNSERSSDQPTGNRSTKWER